MLEYRFYRCDFGHTWRVRRAQGEPEPPGDLRCPLGHEAVTCTRELPADLVQLTIRPAARTVDTVTGKITEQRRFWLVLGDTSGAELAWTVRSYSWAEIVDLAAKFVGLSPARAMTIWKENAL